MNALQAFLASLERSRARALADLHALGEAAWGHITIGPPVWCHGCGRMLAVSGRLVVGGHRVESVCAQCVAERGSRDRRNPSERRLRQLVEVTRLLAWHAQDSADTYDDRGCHEAARVLRELSDAANSAIEALRINRPEGQWANTEATP